ncbi:MAG: ATP-dependent zinc protease [Pseudohongiellaceae bacterium]|nr:ATP-dependent zinc protease [Pseudohongiellaceae bacterium]
MTTSTTKTIVGRKEWCSFPELAIPAVKARVDSGAKTSSLHAFNIKPFERDGEKWVSFEVHPLQKNRKTTIHCEAPILDKRSVKSSSGVAQKRYVISTTLEHNQIQWEIELTLSNRDSMGYRMLLGREAMIGRMMVDPEESFLGGKLSPSQLKARYAKNP